MGKTTYKLWVHGSVVLVTTITAFNHLQKSAQILWARINKYNISHVRFRNMMQDYQETQEHPPYKNNKAIFINWLNALYTDGICELTIVKIVWLRLLNKLKLFEPTCRCSVILSSISLTLIRLQIYRSWIKISPKQKKLSNTRARQKVLSNSEISTKIGLANWIIKTTVTDIGRYLS